MDANVQNKVWNVRIAQLMNIHDIQSLYALFRQYTTDRNALFVACW